MLLLLGQAAWCYWQMVQLLGAGCSWCGLLLMLGVEACCWKASVNCPIALAHDEDVLTTLVNDHVVDGEEGRGGKRRGGKCGGVGWRWWGCGYWQWYG